MKELVSLDGMMKITNRRYRRMKNHQLTAVSLRSWTSGYLEQGDKTDEDKADDPPGEDRNNERRRW